MPNVPRWGRFVYGDNDYSLPQVNLILDQDWNASTNISRFRRQLLGRDAIGPFVAAVPAEMRSSFKVTQAGRLGVDAIFR